jgi:hypothetical protein
MIAFIFTGFEKFLNVYHGHNFLMLSLGLAVECQRRQYDLKTHPVLVGSAAAGKSYILGIINSFCIPGTCRQIGAETGKAYNGQDENYNGTMWLYSEMPEAYKLKEGNDNKNVAVIEITKERLTSGISNTVSNMGNVDGKRITAETSTLCQSNSIFCANTLDFENGPLGTRFSANLLPKDSRIDSSIAAVQKLEQISVGEINLIKNRFIRFLQDTQAGGFFSFFSFFFFFLFFLKKKEKKEKTKIFL